MSTAERRTRVPPRLAELATRLTEVVDPLRVKPGSRVRLPRDFDPAYRAGFVKKKDAAPLLQQGVELLTEYQQRLAAQDTYGLVLCLQAMDAAGKDGTIRHVMSGVNPQGVHVTSFKAPSEEERNHDFLWRCARRLPGRGEIAVFNRSHYEEVLVVRVHPELLQHQNLPEDVEDGDLWAGRYRQINDWERYLVENGIKVVKIFLNLSKEKQRVRLLRRLDLPDHRWKFSASDVTERGRWDDYQRAFSEMLSNTSTSWAPWYVVPADRKWFARVCVSAILAHTMIELDPRYPVVTEAKERELGEIRAALEAEAPADAAPDPFQSDQGG